MQYDRSVNYRAMLGISDSKAFDLLARVMNAGVIPEAAPIFCDVGANLGLYSLFFAHQQPASTVYAFEPGPVVERLRTNLYLNRLTNVVVVEQACSDHIGEVEFFLGHQHYTSSLHASWDGRSRESRQTIRVLATTLDGYFYGAVPRPGPNLIKMDIEGGGTQALKGCTRCIQEKRPLLLIESHTPDEDRSIGNLVLTQDYNAFRLDTHQWVTSPDRAYPHPEGIWGTLLLWPAEKRHQARKIRGL